MTRVSSPRTFSPRLRHCADMEPQRARVALGSGRPGHRTQPQAHRFPTHRALRCLLFPPCCRQSECKADFRSVRPSFSSSHVPGACPGYRQPTAQSGGDASLWRPRWAPGAPGALWFWKRSRAHKVRTQGLCRKRQPPRIPPRVTPRPRESTDVLPYLRNHLG